ncbi:MAG TPA: ankyrin repeat domain-containing protein [Candidatus Methylacidiphilales bacterium]|jgi:ankyrin repeat protein|nr:ankyrin repeat domain-containing protein [Candidatus Methylacidiphilales bacterium]
MRIVVAAFFILVVVASAILTLRSFHPCQPDLSAYAGMTPDETLAYAARHGDLPAMRAALDSGADVNRAPDGGRTPLAAAAESGQLEAVKLLLDRGADINRKTEKSPPPAQAAIESGRTECAQYLLDHGATCDPLPAAAFKDDEAALQPALAAEPVDLKQLQHLAKIAAVNGHADLFRELLSKIRTQVGQSDWEVDNGAVVTAIARGHKEVVQAVLDTSPYLQKLNQGGVMRLSGAAAQSPGMRAWLISKGFSIPQYTDGEQLIDATEHEDLPEMARLLKKGVDINYRGESSWTPITKAAAWNKVRAAKFLLAHGADPNSVHLPGWDYTAICLTDKPEIADAVLKAGGNINATLYKRNVHIMDYAVTFGATDMVKWYLAHGVDPTKVQCDDPSRTFLYDAGNPEIAELLIDHGVDVNHKDKQGETALYWICMFSRHPADTARVLLKHGADPNEKDNRGFTPLMSAKDGATVDALIAGGADVTLKPPDGVNLFSASAYGDASRLAALLRHGVPFDKKTDGPTLMVLAAWRNQVDVISALLAQGVDPNIKGCWNKQANDYMLPLTAAVTDGQYEAAKLLVDHGAKIEEAEDHSEPGMNNMANALHNRRAAMVKLFWEHGDRSISPLLYAVSQGAPLEDVQKLLDSGIPADPPQDKMLTPLADAALLGRMDVVQLLVQHGARVNAGGALNPKAADYVLTPLMLASGEGQDEVVAYLLQHGGKFNNETLWFAVWNCNPYPDQRSKDHFEKTIKLLINAGGLKGLSEKDQAGLLTAAIFSRYPGGNQKVIQMLLDGGLSVNARSDGGKSVLDLAHEACKDETCSTPTREMMAFLEKSSASGKSSP